MFDANQNPAMGMNQGYYYQGMNQPQMQKFNNPLTADEIKSLQQKGAQFSLAISQEEMLRSICNHRKADGTGDALIFDEATGEAMCTICGYKFKPVQPDVSIVSIKEAVLELIDILQTIKLMYVDLPAEAARDYMPIIALLEKVPQLFEFAAKNMVKHESYNWQFNGRNMGAVNMLNSLQNMFANGMGNFGGYQQPQMMGNPAFAQQPYGANGFGYPGAAPQMGNPAFNNGYAATPVAPFVPGAQPTPTVAPTVEAPSAPAATDSATTTATVTV